LWDVGDEFDVISLSGLLVGVRGEILAVKQIADWIMLRFVFSLQVSMIGPLP